MHNPKVIAGLVLLVACVVAGCGPREVPRHPVRGQVFYRKKPLADAQVVFHVVDNSPQAANKPIAITDEQGRFALTTMSRGDGAPPGEYVITIELRELVTVGEEKVRSGRSLLPERYRHLEKSGLRFRVEKGENEVARIELEG